MPGSNRITLMAVKYRFTAMLVYRAAADVSYQSLLKYLQMQLQLAGQHEINDHEYSGCYQHIGDKHAEAGKALAHFSKLTLRTYFCFHCVPIGSN